MNAEEEIPRQITSGTDDDGVQKAAALWRRDPAFRPILLKLTSDKEWEIRRRLAKALGPDASLPQASPSGNGARTGPV
jgi:HEAT repeat protein